MGKFYTVEVKPEIIASKQALGAFADNDVVFSWTPFYMPNGASRLISASLVLRGTDGASQSAAFDIFFAKSFSSSASGVNFEAPGALGAVHATANGTAYYKNILGYARLEENDQASGLDNITIFRSAHDRGRFIDMVLDPEPHSGDVKGFGVMYLGGITVDGDLNLASTCQCDGIQATTLDTLTVKTQLPLNMFDKGDVLHDEDDRLLGTIKEITGATTIDLTSTLANATVNNKDVYCINPISVILSFEM